MEVRGLRKIAAALQNAAAVLNIGIGEQITLFRRCEQTIWPQRKSPNRPTSATPRRANLAAGEQPVTSLLDRNNTGKNPISGDLGAVSAPASHCFDYEP
jgi:hypothetical protein